MDIYDQELKKIQKRLNATEKVPRSEKDLDSEAMKKVDSLAYRYGFGKKELIAALMSSQVTYRLVVGKNPSKMDYYESTLVAYLKTLNCISAVEKLPKRGKGSLHVRNGKLVSNLEKHEDLKSLDLKVTFTNGCVVYVIHKYTRDEGGSQSSAKRDAIMTLKEGAKSGSGRKVNLIAVLDGSYYQKRNKSGSTILETLQASHPKCLITTYQGFESMTESLWSSKKGT